jgi:hypothetical protein
MSKILNFLFSHYVGMIFAGVVLTSTSVQAYPSGALDVASVENPQSQPSTTPVTQTSAPIAPALDTSKQIPQTRTAEPENPKARHLSTEARIIHELHRHGIYW